jgi:hypothetical protein
VAVVTKGLRQSQGERAVAMPALSFVNKLSIRPHHQVGRLGLIVEGTRRDAAIGFRERRNTLADTAAAGRLPPDVLRADGLRSLTIVTVVQADDFRRHHDRTRS